VTRSSPATERWIVEDDPHYARVLLGLAREKGFKGIVAMRGNAALALARQYQPTAITLDIFLPDMLGWTVLNNLKVNPATRHIPVQIVSVEEERSHALAHGAFSYAVKPATTEGLDGSNGSSASSSPAGDACSWSRTTLLSQSIVDFISHDDIEIETASTGADGFEAARPPVRPLRAHLRLPDISGFDLLQRSTGNPAVIPIIVFTGKDLSRERQQLRTMARAS
jgi:DNA-binding response OmpR family regulator